MSNHTKQAAEQSFFVFVRDVNNGKVKRLAIPGDVQVGLLNNPAELQLLGRLSIAATDFSTDNVNKGKISISNHDTVVCVTNHVTPATGRISVHLPAKPRDGQLHFIKDMSGTADSIPIDIFPPQNTLIDDAASRTLNDAYGSIAIFWFKNRWRLLVAGVGPGGGAGGGAGAPVDAAYVTLSNDPTLTEERALINGPNIQVIDDGPNANVTLDLTTLLADPSIGTHTNATVTVDAKGRITAISAGTSPAPVGASYVTLANDATLSAERALTQGTGVRIVDGGANSTVTLSINDNVVATVSGTRFTGRVITSGGLTGSIQHVLGGLSYLVAGDNVTIASQSNGQIIISSTGGGGGGGTDADWVDGGNKLRTTSSVAVGAGTVFAENVSQEAYFFVSGTTGLAGSAAKKAIFGGDVRISGTLTIGTSSLKLDTNTIRTTAHPSSSIWFKDDGKLNFSDANTSPIDLESLAAAASSQQQFVQTFSYTATTQSFVVPDGVTSLDVKLWGAGAGNGGWPSDKGAGAGGYASAKVTVTPGEELLIIVGGAGQGVTGSSGDAGKGGFGGGGDGAKGDASGGGGGGYTGIFTGSVVQQTAIIIAGGGGGGTGYKQGGGGGGTNGQDGFGSGDTQGGSGSGKKGTQSAGGAAGNGSTSPPEAGSALQGGKAVGSRTVSSGNDGGGGGGGYFGGGGGDGDANGGGGGSGYLNPSRTSGGILMQGNNGTTDDSRAQPPNTSDSDYTSAPANTGTGGGQSGSDGQDGGHGYVVIRYSLGRRVAPWLEASEGNAAYITSSIAVGVTASASSSAGREAFVFFSGTIGLTGSAAKKSIFGGDVHVSGSFIALRKVTTVTGSYSVLRGDDYIAVSGSSGPVTLTLPSSPVVGEEHRFKDASGQAATNNITIDGNGKRLDDASTHVISASYGGVVVTFIGNNLWSKLPFPFGT